MIIKKIKHFSLVLFLLVSIGSYGMKRKISDISSTSTPEVYFLPQDDALTRLFSLMDNASSQILIAMYWITDEIFIDKLISLKNKGLSIKVLIDESSFTASKGIDAHVFIDKLSDNNILPIIYPTLEMGGIMHNKFAIIDGAHVFTGSANFTKTAFNLNQSQRSNYENVVILHSNEIAQKYETAFNDIESDSYRLYTDIIAANDIDAVPEKFQYLLPKLPQDRLEKIIKLSWNDYDKTEQNRLKSFFNLKLLQEKPASQYQKDRLKNYYSPQAIEEMSYDEAYKNIAQIIKPWVQKKPASPYQKNILRGFYSPEDIDEMSYEEAYQYIGQIMRKQKQ